MWFIYISAESDKMYLWHHPEQNREIPIFQSCSHQVRSMFKKRSADHIYLFRQVLHFWSESQVTHSAETHVAIRKAQGQHTCSSQLKSAFVPSWNPETVWFLAFSTVYFSSEFTNAMTVQSKPFRNQDVVLQYFSPLHLVEDVLLGSQICCNIAIGN